MWRKQARVYPAFCDLSSDALVLRRAFLAADGEPGPDELDDTERAEFSNL